MNNKYVTIFSSNYDNESFSDIIGSFNSESDATKNTIKYLCENKYNSFGFEILMTLKNDGFWNSHKDGYSDINIGFNLNELDTINDEIQFMNILMNKCNNWNQLKLLCEIFNDSYFEDDPGWRITMKKC